MILAAVTSAPEKMVTLTIPLHKFLHQLLMPHCPSDLMMLP